MLESQCVAQLRQGGSQAPADLLRGKHLPPFLFKDDLERGDVAFRRFLRERPHLFAVRGAAAGQRVEVVEGEEAGIRGGACRGVALRSRLSTQPQPAGFSAVHP